MYKFRLENKNMLSLKDINLCNQRKKQRNIACFDSDITFIYSKREAKLVQIILHSCKG